MDTIKKSVRTAAALSVLAALGLASSADWIDQFFAMVRRFV